MQRHLPHNLTTTIRCPIRCPVTGGPCAAGAAFVDRLEHACRLASGVIGTVPEMSGAWTPAACPNQTGCRLDWRIGADSIILSRAGEALARTNLATQAVQ